MPFLTNFWCVVIFCWGERSKLNINSVLRSKLNSIHYGMGFSSKQACERWTHWEAKVLTENEGPPLFHWHWQLYSSSLCTGLGRWHALRGSPLTREGVQPSCSGSDCIRESRYKTPHTELERVTKNYISPPKKSWSPLQHEFETQCLAESGSGSCNYSYFYTVLGCGGAFLWLNPAVVERS